MADILIAVGIAILTVLMAYMGVHVTLHPPPDTEKGRWRSGFIAIGIAACFLIALQGYRNLRSQQTLNAELSKIERNTETPPTVAVTVPPSQVVITQGSPNQFPVVIKAHIRWDDMLTVVNEGKGGVTDIEIAWGKFLFDPVSAAQKQIAVSQDIYPSRSIPLSPQISKSGIQLDLKKVLPFDGQFLPFVSHESRLNAEFGLRITFRDKQTNVKYACYKVLSAVVHMPEPWGDESSSSGVGKPIWSDSVYGEVISRMKSHYGNDGAVDLQCDH